MIKPDCATISYDYADAQEAVRETIRKTLLETDAAAGGVMRHLTLSQGKNLRAALLLAAALDGGGRVSQNAVTVAAALEILHLATLVHDDVIDDAGTRRGQPSVQRKFGKKTAVICGDFLFCQCFMMVSEISAMYPDRFRDFSAAMTKICRGELRQHRHNADFELSVFDYLKIIAGKTSALFSLSMYAGAVLGQNGERDARRMARIGFDIGMCFQILDDCMDYRADKDVAKKTVRHDLAQGVVTLPLIYALLENPLLKARLKSRRLAAAEIPAVLSEVCHCGGVRHALDVAEKYFKRANQRIANLEDADKRRILGDVLEKIRMNAGM